MAFHRRMVGVGQNHQGYYITPIPARIVLRGLLCACSLADSGNTADYPERFGLGHGHGLHSDGGSSLWGALPRGGSIAEKG